MATASFFKLGDERFVSLTTFRANGEPVSTPVRIAREGDELIVTTPKATGKVKRLRADSRVELRASSRLGRVAEGAELFTGVAEVVEDAAEVAAMGATFLEKYRLEYRIARWIDERSRGGDPARVKLRIRET